MVRSSIRGMPRTERMADAASSDAPCLRRCTGLVLAVCLMAACTSTSDYPPTAPSTGHRLPPQEAAFTANELLKSDIDAVAEVHLRESIASARLLMEKLYRR